MLQFSFISDLLSGCLAQALNTLLTSGGQQKGDEDPAPGRSSLSSPLPPLPSATLTSSLSPPPPPSKRAAAWPSKGWIWPQMWRPCGLQ